MALHILIVEDEPSIADTLIYACKEANMQTTHKLLGHEAIAAHKDKPFDFIILDIGLPDMTGFDVCKKIRETSNVPVLFLTARSQEIDRIVGLEIGADDYVTKPFSPREVIARIKAILRRSEHSASTTPQSQQFKLDESACRIEYHGQHLNLTRYEYLLLKTLIGQPKRIFSRSQLMDLVWQDAEDTLERTVDAHIKTLRAKLKATDAPTNTIITHRGMGYSLEQ
jgi:two-component system catabolic regulation response regulator CreB